MRARHGGARRDHDEGEVGGFDGALEAIPETGGRAAEFALGGVAQIEDDEAEVGVAGEEVGGGELTPKLRQHFGRGNHGRNRK